MRILLGEAADERVIISGPEIVGAGLGVEILPAVAEGVRVAGCRGPFVAEGVVVVAALDRAAWAGLF